MVALAEDTPPPLAVRFWPQSQQLPIAVRDWPQGLGPPRKPQEKPPPPDVSASKPLTLRPIAVRTWVPKPEPKKPRLDQDNNAAHNLDSDKRPSCFKARPDSPDRSVNVKPLKKRKPEDAAAKPFTKRHYPAPMPSLPDRQRVLQAMEEFERLRLEFKKENDGTGGRRRPDMDAWSEIRGRKPELCCSKQDVIGHAPGVEVGDLFYYRSEICLVGLHKQIQGGISWIKDDYGEPIATSVVFSGGYADDRDHGDTFVYTGSGGNNAVADKQLQATDQKLERGNLGLMNSHKRRKPVRVIRGVEDDSSPSNKVYSYDGLYDVVDVMQDTGANGCLIYKFMLKRCPDQPSRGGTLVPCGKQKKSKLSR